MTVNQLLRELKTDRSLISRANSRDEKAVRYGFIKMRVQLWLRLHGVEGINRRRTAIPASAAATINTFKQNLKTDAGLANTAFNSIWTRVQNDADKHLPLAQVDNRLWRRYIRLGVIPRRRRGKEASLHVMRRRLVRSIVWRAGAADATLLQTTNLEALHMLVDRRLRVTERMLYDVTKTSSRRWRLSSAEWSDGWERIFEYPRVPQGPFRTLCQVEPPTSGASSRDCTTTDMSGWYLESGDSRFFKRSIKLNGSAFPHWIPVNGYEFHFNKGSGISPSDAIKQLFVKSTDYRKRNLLYCDHVLHALHLEGLLFAKEKRDPDMSWLTSLVNSKPDGWLRIYIPFGSGYLGSGSGSTYFSLEASVHFNEFQVGDHVIVYNHPAYDNATTGPWRLENAYVVQADPVLRFQGHGIDPLGISQMKRAMLGYFNPALQNLRKQVEEATGTSIRLSRAELVKRTDLSTTHGWEFASSVSKAEWWLRWEVIVGEFATGYELDALRDDMRRQQAWQLQRVEYKQEGSRWFGHFPLWLPKIKRNGRPVTDSSGLVSRIQPVQVTAPMIAAWNWFFPTMLSARGKTAVIRPTKEL